MKRFPILDAGSAVSAISFGGLSRRILSVRNHTARQTGQGLLPGHSVSGRILYQMVLVCMPLG